MSLLDLPNETILSIVAHLRHESDINALAQTNRRIYFLLNFHLYRFAVQRGNNSGLRWAAYHGYLPLIRMLLDIGANVRATPRDSRHLTALHLASARGYTSIVEALIESGAIVNAQTSTCELPLHVAVTGGFYDVTRVLLEHGADFMKPFPKRERPTVLHIASYLGLTDIVWLLLERGMSIEVKDGLMRTPLHYAVGKEDNEWYGNSQTVSFLLQRKANREAWDNLGRRPKDRAKDHPCQTVELLLQNGFGINFDVAVQKEQRLRVKREQMETKLRKVEEQASQRAAKRIERMREEGGKLEMEKVAKEVEEAEEESNRVERNRLADLARELEETQDILRQDWARKRVEADKKQSRLEADAAKKQQLRLEEEIRYVFTSEKDLASRKAWAKIRINAEERRQQPDLASPRPPCPHPPPGWLTCKGRTQCAICRRMCTKSSFRCGDCSIRVCLRCKSNTAGADTRRK